MQARKPQESNDWWDKWDKEEERARLQAIQGANIQTRAKNQHARPVPPTLTLNDKHFPPLRAAGPPPSNAPGQQTFKNILNEAQRLAAALGQRAIPLISLFTAISKLIQDVTHPNSKLST